MPMTYAELQSWVSDIKFNDWQFKIAPDGSSYYLQIVNTCGKDNVTGEPIVWTGRKWRISVWMTKSEVIQTAFMAVKAALEHEAREQFKYKGESVFDPHYDIEALVELRRSERMEKRH